MQCMDLVLIHARFKHGNQVRPLQANTLFPISRLHGFLGPQQFFIISHFTHYLMVFQNSRFETILYYICMKKRVSI